MIMAVEGAGSTLSFEEVQEKLAKKGSELGVEIQIRHEDIFNAMHNI